MYAFFQEHLINPGNPDDETVKILTAEEMQVTKTGQVSTSLGGETVFSLNSKEAEKLAVKLQSSRTDPDKFIPEVLNFARKLSGYQEPSDIDEPVFSGRYRKEGYVIEKYFIKGEGNYIIPYLLMIPSMPGNKCLIYLHPSGKSAEATTGGEMEWFVRHGFTVLAPDLVGVGEMGPGVFQGDAYIEGGSHNMWYASMLIGRSIVGIRAGDVVKLSHLLKKTGNFGEIYAVSRKEMGPVIVHAAAFEPSISRIALIEPYSSYLSVVSNRFYSSSFIPGVVPGVLKAYDLPDIEACLAPRHLLMAGVTDGYGKMTNTAGIINDLEIVRNAYKRKNAEENLRIISIAVTNNPDLLFLDWIK
jgi:hypothetical protein